MTQKKEQLQVTQPAPLSLASIRRPICAGNGALICWDEETRFGGLYFIEPGLWHTFGPLEDRQAFVRFLGNAFPEAAAALH